MDEPTLRHHILGALAATLPLATIAACGNNNNNCQSMCCNLPPAQQYTVTYAVCPQVVFDAGSDASDDASGDASDDAAPTDGGSDADAGMQTQCYSSCYEACQAEKPYSQGGMGSCVGDVDGGDGGVRVAQCQILYLCGRRLDGLAPPSSGRSTRLGEALARAAWLEAASIRAFEQLARELRTHGAPVQLVRAARVCARDEARHARMMARLARRHGARVPAVVVEERGVRDLEAIARENAVEGCVGETYGALLAAWPSHRAGDADIRRAMGAIAGDELRHAALGWAVASWVEPRLDAAARARVERARHEAVHNLIRETAREPNAEVAFATGAPSAAHAQRLATAMIDAGVWVTMAA
jgi:hypothetical protein